MSRTPIATLAAACLIAAPLAAETDDEDLAQEDRIEQLERKVELLTDELAQTRQDMGVPEEKPLDSSWGLGPAASKVYGIGKGLSIGGYAEGLYSAIVADKRSSGARNHADFVRAVLYTGYKFTDQIIFNTEIEFEHASTEVNGAVSVEFATLDYLYRDELNGRMGLVLMPMGFINQIHEPPFYYGTHRPDVERLIIPSTWREYGAGLFGRIADRLEYKLYAVTSMNAAGFDASGLRDGRQQGSEALAEDLAFVGRLDYEPIPELEIGGSVFVGNTGQDQDFDTNSDGFDDVSLRDTPLVLWEAHAQLETHGLRSRALVTMAHLDDAGPLTLALRTTGDIGAAEVIATELLGVYGEVGYEVMQWLAPDSRWTVEPFVRFEHVDTQYDVPSGFAADHTKEFNVYTVGLSVKPIPNVVVKLDYRNRAARSGALGDEVNLGMGLVF